jgi:hypothetical protein
VQGKVPDLVRRSRRTTEPAVYLSPQDLCGLPFFEALHAQATAKRMTKIMIAHETELAPALMAYFHDDLSPSK